MPAGQLLVATLVSNFYAILFVATGFERWVAATRRFVELIKTEAAGCGICVALCLFTSVAKMIWFFLTLRAEVV
jgi:divalent metal cation (Fe/Co/Zn/Cd) transporter